MMELTKFSKKQGEILKFAYNDEAAIVCDGAVRSGKTIVMSLAFVLWAMSNFNKTNFAICGKTVSNAERNILRPFQQIEGMPFELNYKLSSRMLTVKCGKAENYFYLFGGKDESSYALIQGLTLAGVLFDEVALMPQSFVDQAIARTLSFKNAKLWFNCNPESPNHWFYKDWIKNEKREFRHLHFLMTDNPILGAEEIKRADALFSGVFHDRYIKGLWVRAEGVIYNLIADNPERYMINREDVPELHDVNVGFDFGASRSGHAIVCSGIGEDGVLYTMSATYRDAQGTTTEEVIKWSIQTFEDIYKDVGQRFAIYPDSAEQMMINSLRERTSFNVYNSLKLPIIDRIRAVNILMAKDRIKFVRGKTEVLVKALTEAVWDDKSLKDKRLDNFSYNLDVIDAFEYSFEYNIRRLITQ